jgi:hypothetical protein
MPVDGDDEEAFYTAFWRDVEAAGLESRDHWHPDPDVAVIYKLREPRSGKVMRFRVEYKSERGKDNGARFAANAVVRFFNRPEPSVKDAPSASA